MRDGPPTLHTVRGLYGIWQMKGAAPLKVLHHDNERLAAFAGKRGPKKPKRYGDVMSHDGRVMLVRDHGPGQGGRVVASFAFHCERPSADVFRAASACAERLNREQGG